MVIVTFRRRGRSGAIFQIAFTCGEHNNLLILKEAWNTNSEIVSVEVMA